MTTLRSRILARTTTASYEESDRRLAWLLVAPGLGLMGLLLLAPLALAVVDSVHATSMATGSGPFVGLANYAELLLSEEFYRALIRTVLWVITNVVGQTLVGLAVALVLHESFRGRGVVRAIVLIPYVAPIIVVALVWRFILNETFGLVSYPQAYGWTDTTPTLLSRPDTALPTVLLVNIWRYVPFMVILFLARMQTVPPELYDAAAVDGAGYWRSTWSITIAWLRPVIVIAMLLRTIWAFADFDLLFLLAHGGPLSATTTLPLLLRTIAFDRLDGGMASALGVTMAAVLFGAYLVYQRAYRKSEAELD